MANDKVEEFRDEDIVEMDKEIYDAKPDKILHTEGFNAIEAVLEHISQQEEATPADII